MFLVTLLACQIVSLLSLCVCVFFVFFAGALHPKSNVGIYACDPNAYTDPIWSDLFKAIIQEYHTGDSKNNVKHPNPDFGTDAQIDSLGDLDPSGMFVVSTRVRVGRSHNNMPFPPAAVKAVLY